ncbi:MAG: prephenate dehydratase [Pseudomonadota bacterium]
MAEPRQKIAFQGEPGAYSHLACARYAPDLEPFATPTFDDVFEAVKSGRAAKAMIPVENSLAGRVTDIHRLLPETDLHIVAEHLMRVNHHLLGVPGADLSKVKRVFSHAMALGQCLDVIHELGLEAVAAGDTAGAAKALAERPDHERAVIASELAAETYGLEILRRDVEDAEHNTTRFIVMAPEPADPRPGDGKVITTFVFNVRNIPAALYKALGGFATNGVNMTKLESYQLGGSFAATRFYADIEGHPEERPVQLALEELGFFSASFKILGVYPAAPDR